MKETLSPGESQLLWMLATRDEEGAFEEVLRHRKSANEKPHREALVKRGFIVVSKQQRKIFLKMTAAGWGYCNGMVGWVPPAGPKSKADLFLQWLMPRLKKVFDDSSSPANFSDFLNKSAAEAGKTPVVPAPDGSQEPVDPTYVPVAIEEAIRSACLAIGGGQRAVRVRIADLRKQLIVFSEAEVTDALWTMSERKELTMFRLDDPQQVTAEDRKAAVLSTLGQELHIIYYGGTQS